MCVYAAALCMYCFVLYVLYGRWLLRGWLHCEDFGLFYHNIRQNIAQRIEAFSTVRVIISVFNCQSNSMKATQKLTKSK